MQSDVCASHELPRLILVECPGLWLQFLYVACMMIVLLSRPHILSGIGLSGSISQYNSLVHFYMFVAYAPYLWLLETIM